MVVAEVLQAVATDAGYDGELSLEAFASADLLCVLKEPEESSAREGYGEGGTGYYGGSDDNDGQ